MHRSHTAEVGAERQELRLAVVMTGGVSLAIWMGGTAYELERLQRRGTDTAYAELLELTRSAPRIDVISGTSAGGLNGALLAAALAYGHPLGSLRSTWLRDGALKDLTRDPYGKNHASLLDGDGYFMRRLKDAFATIIGNDALALETPLTLLMTAALMQGRRTTFTDRYRHEMPEVEHLALFRFAGEDFAAPSVVDQLALAARTSAAHPGGFEASFVPVNEDAATATKRPDMRGRIRVGDSDLPSSRFAVDGGVLLNRPLKPALEQVLREPAAAEVRRLLVFVAPDPGEVLEDGPDDPDEDAPTFFRTVTSAARLPMVQSIAEQLRDLRDHNTQVARQRSIRKALSRSGPNLEAALPTLFPAYVSIRAEQSAAMVADLLIPGVSSSAWSGPRPRLHEELASSFAATLPPAPTDRFGVRVEPWGWGIPPVARSLFLIRELLREAISIAPVNGSEDDSLGPLRTEIERLRAISYILADRSRTLRGRERDFWRQLQSQVPGSADLGGWVVGRLSGLPDWLAQRDRDEPEGALSRWRWGSTGFDPRGELAILTALLMTASAPSISLAGYAVLAQGAREPASVAPSHLARAQGLLARLYGLAGVPASKQPSSMDPDDLRAWSLRADSPLLRPEEDPWASALRPSIVLGMVNLALADLAAFPATLEFPGGVDDVAREAQFWLWRLLLFDVAVLPALPEEPVGQEIELVQVSARVDNAFDPRREPKKKLTGLQLAHFGAFYKRSWRANDWMWGRLDGAYHQAEILLDAARLQRLGYASDDAFAGIAAIARGGRRDLSDYLASTEAGLPENVRAELTYLDESDAEPPPSLPHSARWVSRRLQLEILVEELPWVARAVADDMANGASQQEAARTFLSSYLGMPPDGQSLRVIQRQLRRALETGPGAVPVLTPKKAAELLPECRVGEETIKGELETDMFSATASKVVATLMGVLGGDRSGLGPVRPVIASARGATLALYSLMRGALSNSRTSAVLITGAIVLSAVILAADVIIDKFDSVELVTTIAVALLAGGLTASALRVLWPVPVVVFALATLTGFLLAILVAPSDSAWGLAVVVIGAMLIVALLHGWARAIRDGGWPRGAFMALCLALGLGGLAAFVGLPIPFGHPGLESDCGAPVRDLRLTLPSATPTATSGPEAIEETDELLCAGMVRDWEIRALALFALAVGTGGLLALRRRTGDRLPLESDDACDGPTSGAEPLVEGPDSRLD